MKNCKSKQKEGNAAKGCKHHTRAGAQGKQGVAVQGGPHEGAPAKAPSEMEKEGLQEGGVALFCLYWLVDINSNLTLITLTNLSKPTSEGKVYHCLLQCFKEKIS